MMRIAGRLVLFFSIAVACVSAQVTLSGAASPAAAEPGATLVTITGTNFPSTSILPSHVNVRLSPATANAGPSAITTASGVQAVVGTTLRITFQVPVTVVVAAATPYLVSVSGTAADGTAFQSVNTVPLTIQPVAGILSSSPAALQTGQAGALLIKTQFGSFTQGATQAFAGPDVSVGVQPEGSQAPAADAFGIPGRVIVVDSNTLLTVIRASSTASEGSRDLTLQQGASIYQRPGALTLQTNAPSPSGGNTTALATLTSPVSPTAGSPGTTTFRLTVSGLPTDTLMTSQVRLLLEPKLDSSTLAPLTVTPLSIGADSAGSRIITFPVPSGLVLSANTDFLITLYGSTSNYGASPTGSTFLSGNRALVTLNPPSSASPTLSTLSPFAGTQGTSVQVAITGSNTNFVAGQTVAFFGPGIAVGGAAAGQFGPVAVSSATQATATVTIQPGATLGARDVELRTNQEVATLRGGFQVLPGAAILTVSTIQPATIRPGGSAVITGKGFPSSAIAANGVSVALAPVAPGIGPGRTITATSISAPDSNGSRQVTFALPVDFNFPQPIAYSASVSGVSTDGIPFTTATPVAFTVQPLPRLLSITPNSGARGQTVNVTVTGQYTNFSSGPITLDLGTAGITVANVTAYSPTLLNAALTIAASATLGPRNVTVTSGSDPAALLPSGFTVVAPQPASVTLSSTTTPQSARAGDTVSVTASNVPSGDITPSQVAVTLQAVGNGLPFQAITTSVTDNGGGTRLVRFQIPASIVISKDTAYLVTITGATAAGAAFTSSNAAALTLQAPLANPTLTNITPGQGFQGQTLTVTVTGQNTSFTSASSQVSFGAGITVVSTTVNGPASISTQIAIAASALPGLRNVSVTTGAQSVTATGGFTVVASPPAVSLVSPTQGVQGATVAVTVQGQNTHFAPGATTVAMSGTGATAANLTVQNALSLSFQLTIAADAATGTRTLTVTSGAEIVTALFTIAPAPASISSVNPASGSAGQSLSLSVTGQNTSFGPSTVAAFSGSGITVTSTNAASSTALTVQIAIDPAAATGARTLTVTTGAQAVSANFAVTAGNGSTMSITSVTPGVGATGSSLPVTIVGSGTSFNSAKSVVSFGAGISPGPLNVNSTTQLSTTLTVAPDAAPGTRNVTVTTGAEVAILTAGFAVVGPSITIQTPADKSFVNTPSITVSGTVTDANATVAVNGVSAPNSGGQFSVAIPLSEGNNTVTAVATSTSGATSSTSVLVNLDTTPPRVAVLTPLDQDETTESQINVAGNVNDIVVGTVNNVQAQVTVNGVPAQVANRSFVALGVPLQPGLNTLQVVARDRVGNSSTTSLSVTRVMAPQVKLSVVSGNNQSAPINGALPQPVVVQLTDGLGTPKANASVFFRVTGNNGSVAAASGSASTTSLTAEVKADAQGQAKAYWTLGSRSGAGINRLEVGATGVTAPAVFTATGQPGAAARIVVDSGLNQTGAVGQKLPLPFVAVVIDSGNNRIGGVPVTLSVRNGGGKFDGQDSVVLTSDPDGRVAATLTLGPQEGQENNEVVADFAGDTANPAIFTASGRVPSTALTLVTGVVLDNSNQPVPGVTVSLYALNQGASSNLPLTIGAAAVTDAKGQFEIDDAPVGVFKLRADGSTATGGARYPVLEFDVTTVAGQNNSLPGPIFMVALDQVTQLCVDDATGGTLTLPKVPGFALTVAAGAATFPGGSKRGCISVTPVNIDKVPMAPGFGQQPRFVVTIQPVGTIFNPPARITIPNVDGLAPNAVTELYSYDHDLASFVSIGRGQTSPDGLTITSVNGAGVLKAGWHCGGDPTANGNVADCKACKKCQNGSCVTDDTLSCDDSDVCTSCDGEKLGADCCQGGRCQGKRLDKVDSTVIWDYNNIKDLFTNFDKVQAALEFLWEFGGAFTRFACIPSDDHYREPILAAKDEEGTFCCSNSGDGSPALQKGHRATISVGAQLKIDCIAAGFVPAFIAQYVDGPSLHIVAEGGVTGGGSRLDTSCIGPEQCRVQGGLSVGVSATFNVVKLSGLFQLSIEFGKAEGNVSVSCACSATDCKFSGNACFSVIGKVKAVFFGGEFQFGEWKLVDETCLY